MDSPRIPPVEPPYESDVMDELARWMPKGAPVEPLALFRTLARHLPLARAMLPLGTYLLGREAALGTRERELVIQRVCARLGCEYEWGVHATFFGSSAGIDAKTMKATVLGRPDDKIWRGTDALLVRLVDELHYGACVSDALWTELAAAFTPPQLLEMLVLAGWYHVIAFVANGAGVAREPWAERFPPL
ncbi:MAG: carboxymuconolactone decarboxylase family protein [Deltaproteobacteria bacterium]|nr:carboxymuconolactone decarboxylase family protein [Deltaproteobacteria bacterium]